MFIYKNFEVRKFVFDIVTIEGIDSGVRQGSVAVKHKFSGFNLVAEKKSNETVFTFLFNRLLIIYIQYIGN